MQGGPWPTISLILLYLYFVKVAGPQMMKGRKPFDLRNVIFSYNILLVALNGWFFYTGCWLSSFGLDSWKCTLVDYKSHDPLDLFKIRIGWLFLMSKFIRFFRHHLFRASEKGFTSDAAARPAPFLHAAVLLDRSEVCSRRQFRLLSLDQLRCPHHHVHLLRPVHFRLPETLSLVEEVHHEDPNDTVCAGDRARRLLHDDPRLPVAARLHVPQHLQCLPLPDALLLLLQKIVQQHAEKPKARVINHESQQQRQTKHSGPRERR